MTIINPERDLCTCGHKYERAEGRTVVCAGCGKPKRLPYCVNCKFYKFNDTGRFESEKNICTYPVFKGVDLVTGCAITNESRNAHKFRQDEENNCGKRGRFWQARDK